MAHRTAARLQEEVRRPLPGAIGTIYADAGGGAATWAGCKAAIESLGGKVLYERGFQAAETDFTADIVGMQRAGVKMIYVIASDAPSFARLVTAARQQSVDWPLLAGGIAYDQGFIQRAGAASEGVYNDQQFAMFFNKEEAAVVPAVKDFQGPGPTRSRRGRSSTCSRSTAGQRHSCSSRPCSRPGRRRNAPTSSRSSRTSTASTPTA